MLITQITESIWTDDLLISTTLARRLSLNLLIFQLLAVLSSLTSLFLPRFQFSCSWHGKELCGNDRCQ